MLLRTTLAAALGAALLVGAGARPTPATPVGMIESAGGDTFVIDRAHSMLLYKLRHFGVSYFHGRVNMPTGEFSIDDDDLAGSFLNVAAEIKNMDTGNDGRDRFIMSPDFFNVRENPTTDFKSTAVRKISEGTYEVDGNLTMHGVTQPVTARLEHYTAMQTERFGYRAGFECRVTVKRSDFGMDLFVKEGTLGNEVTITASIEGLVQPAE